MSLKLHYDGTKPKEDQIFVFGSNLAGRHGAGAAKAALSYGAKLGFGIGFHGRTYAIPTKDENIRSLPTSLIRFYVDNFKTFVLEYPELEFFVTRIGCGLAGYKDYQIAPMFKDFPENCSFAMEWRQFLI